MLKTILVPLSGTAGDGSLLELAYLAAQRFGSHLQCLYVRLDPRDMISGTASIGMGMPLITPELWTAIEGDEKSRKSFARSTFDAFCANNGVKETDVPIKPDVVTAAWREVTGDSVSHIVEFARTAELTVLARDADPANSFDQIGDVLIRSGRPVILASREVPTTFISTIAIAWKSTPEAARALTAAMPVLLKARKVIILSADEGHSGATTIESAAQLGHCLRWNGIEAQQHLVPHAPDAPREILRAVAEAGADLLVMGAYGHSRARELILGGLTRRVLLEATLPVLLCH
jgi:hypothetical protein